MSLTYPTQTELSALLPYLTPQERVEMVALTKSLPPTFSQWLPTITPQWTWDWRYQVYIQQHLQRVTNGEIDRLMLFVPPRHTKSEMVTIRYPVWRIKRRPDMRVIIAAHGQLLASKFSRRAMQIARTEMDLARETADDWETTEGGGVRAVGVGGSITGQGGNLIVIDDPVKGRAQAESQTYQELAFDWYTNDIYTRLEPGGQMILIMTRWHEADLAGRILASEEGPEWTVISLPANAEKDDPLGRPIGAALCPDRYDEEKLKRIKAVLGTYNYSALYQQHPMPAEGGMFHRDWLPIISESPATFDMLVRYWDKGATAGGGDYTVGALIGKVGGRFYVVDVVRGRWSTDQRETIIKQTAITDAGRFSNAVIWLEQEPGAGGKDSTRYTIQNLAGFTIKAERPTGDKAVRAEPFAAQAEAGNVTLIEGRWNAAYINELTSFPYGAHDDQVDASSGAFNKVALSRPQRRAQTGSR